MIAALLLAAGSARRFGAPKLLCPLNGKPVLRWCAEALLRSGVDELLVVAPVDAEPFADALRGLPLRFVSNAQPDRGIGRSIAVGIDALAPMTEAALVALGDEPGLEDAVVRAVVRRHRETRIAVVAPVFQGVRGHPVLFARSVFPELAALDGDAGARSVVDRDPGRVSVVEIGTGAPGDVDTREDLARLAALPQFSPTPSPPDR